jgi:hypothetical protein
MLSLAFAAVMMHVTFVYGLKFQLWQGAECTLKLLTVYRALELLCQLLIVRVELAKYGPYLHLAGWRPRVPHPARAHDSSARTGATYCCPYQ